MNERIKELAREAGPTTIGEINTKIGNVHVINIEKFAELIAKEYIKDCRDMFIVGSVSWNLLNEKLEHFGVEE